VSILSDRWAWANERLKLNKNITMFNSKNFNESLFLHRLGMTVNFVFEDNSLVLVVSSFFRTFVKLKICSLDSDEWYLTNWWCETPRYSFIPARLNTRNKDMDAVVCTLNSMNHQTRRVLVDLSDPADIYVLCEKRENDDEFVHISECSFIMLSNISILKYLALQCDNNLWSLRFEGSEHPEYDDKKWSMIRTTQGYYFIYTFENNIQVSKNILLKSYPGQGNLQSVGAGKFVMHLQHDGELRILNNLENTWVYFNNDIKFTKIIESYYDGKSLIVFRDLISGVFLINTKNANSWKLEHLQFCKPKEMLSIFFNHKNSMLHWIDSNNRPNCKSLGG
jgi:hypothetical protein